MLDLTPPKTNEGIPGSSGCGHLNFRHGKYSKFICFCSSGFMGMRAWGLTQCSNWWVASPFTQKKIGLITSKNTIVDLYFFFVCVCGSVTGFFCPDFRGAFSEGRGSRVQRVSDRNGSIWNLGIQTDAPYWQPGGCKQFRCDQLL